MCLLAGLACPWAMQQVRLASPRHRAAHVAVLTAAPLPSSWPVVMWPVQQRIIMRGPVLDTCSSTSGMLLLPLLLLHLCAGECVAW